MNRDIIIDFINKTLNVEQGKDPWVFNGLQVIGKKEVKKICLGVSPSLEFFKKAEGDLIILHHGLFGPKLATTITQMVKNRLEVLFAKNITLLSYHLYLDNHPTLGNNAQLIKLLRAKLGQPFGDQEGVFWGFEGSYSKPVPEEVFRKKINSLCPGTRYFGKGSGKISRFGIVTGGGAYIIKEAIDKKLDAFLTGEIVESLPAMTQEAGIHYYALGHYNSEKFGVKAIGEVLKKKFPKVEIEFIDIPNKL